jgi:hypothetical protein
MYTEGVSTWNFVQNKSWNYGMNLGYLCFSSFFRFLFPFSSFLVVLSYLLSDSHWAGQEILHYLCNLKVHYHVHKSLPKIPILSPLNSVHILTHYPNLLWWQCSMFTCISQSISRLKLCISLISPFLLHNLPISSILITLLLPLLSLSMIDFKYQWHCLNSVLFTIKLNCLKLKYCHTSQQLKNI